MKAAKMMVIENLLSKERKSLLKMMKIEKKVSKKKRDHWVIQIILSILIISLMKAAKTMVIENLLSKERRNLKTEKDQKTLNLKNLEKNNNISFSEFYTDY